MQNLMPPVDTPDELFHDGDPTQGLEGTVVEAQWLNDSQGATRDTQQEIINVLLAAGINPDPANQSQLLQALQSMISGDIGDAMEGALMTANNLSEIADAGADAQQAARDNLGLTEAATLPPGGLMTSINDKSPDASGHVDLYVFDQDVTLAQNLAVQGAGSIEKHGVVNDPAAGTNITYGQRLHGVAGQSSDDYLWEQIGVGLTRVIRVTDGAGSSRYFKLASDGSFAVDGRVYTGLGQAFVAEDGDLFGPAWGNDWLSNWLNNAMVRDVMLGAEYWVGWNGDADTRGPEGHVLTGLREESGDNEIHSYLFKPIQKLIGDQWYTIGG